MKPLPPEALASPSAAEEMPESPPVAAAEARAEAPAQVSSIATIARSRLRTVCPQSLLVHVADYIRADERTHVRKGQGIIKVMTNMDAKALELRTRELFTECLVSLGVVKKDMDVFTVTREDIEQLVGE